jgi:hypothetical protein
VGENAFLFDNLKKLYNQRRKMSMNLKQIVEQLVGSVDNVLFARAYSAFIMKHDKFPDKQNKEHLDWIVNYIVKEAGLQ